MGKWKIVAFDEVLTIINGKNQKQVENPSGKYPIYGSGGVMGYADDYLCEANTVVIGRKGTINRPIFVEEPFWNVDTAFGLCAKNILHPKYLFYFCEQFDFETLNTTVTIPSLTKANLLKIKIPLPPLPVQQQIADALDCASALIEKRKAQIEKLDLLVKSQFIEMFGDPVTNPMGWGVQSLKDICTKLTDGTHFSPESYQSGDYMYITAKNIKPGGLDFSNITYVKTDVHNQIYARCNPECGDVLYIKDGVTTGIAIVNTLQEPFTMLSSVALLKQNRLIVTGEYLCGVLNNKNMYSAIRGNMGGAAITRLTIAKLNKVELPIPPITLQTQFADFVQQVEAQKSLLQQSLAKLEKNYKSLMQKCFKGEMFNE
ncbi:restriction endonuclease subunit S [Anaeropeptidivorans aminofermentans]|uniref:restriction endonuclease subunit S n=1 Tax=Anaeropeptidivorans aminofermentans TaxID=2934315 RepID=UPI002024F764|nr:restriction endonuclease subunit S [Anaeropeptidivorans aminofermentans]